MFIGRPQTVAECDILIDRVTQAQHECGCNEKALLCAYADELVELESIKAALTDIPRQRVAPEHPEITQGLT